MKAYWIYFCAKLYPIFNSPFFILSMFIYILSFSVQVRKVLHNLRYKSFQIRVWDSLPFIIKLYFPLQVSLIRIYSILYHQQMFQNTFQNGNFFELYDPKASQDKTKLLYKQSNVHGNNKIFDKELKTYVLQFATPTSKICFPKEQKKQLYLIQQYLTLQIYLFPGMSWSIQLVVSDHTKTKRRIMLSSATHKIQMKPFFVKFPCPLVNQGVWMNFSVDLHSFISAFKGQNYRSLDAIYLTGHFKLRRIYTTNSKPEDGMAQQIESQQFKKIHLQDINLLSLPKNFYYPPGIQFSSHVISFEENLMFDQVYEPTQSSTKNTSHIKSRLNIQTPNGYKNEKKFLANTNGPEMLNRKKKKEMNSEQKGEQTDNSIQTPLSTTDKNIKKRKVVQKKPLIKKHKSSIEKRKVEEKSRGKAKINPWRAKESDTSQFSNSKAENERSLESSKTTLFKTKNNLTSKFNESKNKGFDKKSQHYSDSEYVELSQKFSTVTDGKFMKNQLGSIHLNQEKKQNHQEEIEQNIEMETNSICSRSHIKNESLIKAELNNNIGNIEESILIEEKKQEPKDEFGISSYFGFGKRIMNKFVGQIERPYSPPIGEKDMTQEGSEHHENQEEKQIQLIYDPVLNCYYDHRTHTYYELKN